MKAVVIYSRMHSNGLHRHTQDWRKSSKVGLLWSFALPLCFSKSSLRDSYTVKECVGGINKGAAGYVPDSAGSGWPSSSAPSYWSPASGLATWSCCGGTQGRCHPPGPGARWASPLSASLPPCSCCCCTRPLQRRGVGEKQLASRSSCQGNGVVVSSRFASAMVTHVITVTETKKVWRTLSYDGCRGLSNEKQDESCTADAE